MNNIIKETLNLIVDQFGNYLVQYVLMKRDQNNNKRIIKALIPQLIIVCKQKYASNVIEKVKFYIFINII
jgi:hypothetical protein